NFDEPQALEIVEKHPTVLGIHGCKSKNCSQDICIGGLDEPLKQALATQFDNFDFRHTNTGHQFPAQKPSNICNLGTRKMGAQLELRHDFRKNLRNNSKLFEQFISAVRNALAAFSINIVPMDSNQ
ncbi:MAG: poly-gamma-glutamate hydrolase family protein, partial [Rhodobacteraceae bacterium]|nr:poly-gamma-glutamate hydrolase family protein [Paracoccaceae bacterium]